MSEEAGSYAMMKTGSTIVENIIVADQNFSLEGYRFIRYEKEKVFCQSGMFYKEDNELFYDDQKFTTINGS